MFHFRSKKQKLLRQKADQLLPMVGNSAGYRLTLISIIKLLCLMFGSDIQSFLFIKIHETNAK